MACGLLGDPTNEAFHQEGAMRNNVKYFLGIAVLVLLYAVNVGAQTITFDSVPSNPSNPDLTTLTTDGFTFTSQHFHTIDSFAGLASNGTIYIAEEASNVGFPITMARSNGLPFSLYGFDGAELFVDVTNFPNANYIQLAGVLAGGGTVNASFLLDGIIDGPGGVADFQRFVLPAGWTDLASVTFSGAYLYQDGSTSPGGSISLDNIVVPEPATMLLLGLAIIGVAGVRRFRK